MRIDKAGTKYACTDKGHGTMNFSKVLDIARRLFIISYLKTVLAWFLNLVRPPPIVKVSEIHIGCTSNVNMHSNQLLTASCTVISQ